MHGFLFINKRLLISCDTGIYAIIIFFFVLHRTQATMITRQLRDLIKCLEQSKISNSYEQYTEADRGHFTVKLLCFFTLLQNFHFCKICTSTKFSLLQNFHFCKIFTSTKFSLLQNFHFYVFSHFYKIFTSAKFSLLRFFTLLQNFHFCKIFKSTAGNNGGKFVSSTTLNAK